MSPFKMNPEQGRTIFDLDVVRTGFTADPALHQAGSLQLDCQTTTSGYSNACVTAISRCLISTVPGGAGRCTTCN